MKNKRLSPKSERILQRLFWIIAILIVCVCWITFGAYSFFCAVSFKCVSDASGWWSLFITILGIPILFFQIVSLQKTIKENYKEPKITIGVYQTAYLHQVSVNRKSHLPINQVYDLKDYLYSVKQYGMPSKVSAFWRSYERILDNVTEQDRANDLKHKQISNYPFFFFVQNTGNLAARFIKIETKLLAYPGEQRPVFTIHDLEVGKDVPSSVSYNSYTFTGPENRLIHPDDYQIFPFYIRSEQHSLADAIESGSLEPVDISDVVVPGMYKLEFTFWADGLEKANRQTLMLEIIDSRTADEIKQGIEERKFKGLRPAEVVSGNPFDD